MANIHILNISYFVPSFQCIFPSFLLNGEKNKRQTDLSRLCRHQSFDFRVYIPSICIFILLRADLLHSLWNCYRRSLSFGVYSFLIRHSASSWIPKNQGDFVWKLGDFCRIPDNTHGYKRVIYLVKLFAYRFDRIFKDPNSGDNFSSMAFVPHYLLMGACYLSGLTIYVVQCPERWRPGKFDIWVN